MTPPSRLTGSRRGWMAVAVLLALTSLSAVPAQGRDHEFGQMVRYVEGHYHAKRQYRVLMVFAGLAVKIAGRSYGVKGLKLAMWENPRLRLNGNGFDFVEVVHAGLSQDWQPLVRVWSKRDGEWTMIFSKPAGKQGKDLKLLIANVDNEDAVVMEARLNPDRLSQWIAQESHQGRDRGRDDGQNSVGGADPSAPPLQTVALR